MATVIDSSQGRQYSLTVTGTGWTTVRAVGVVYQTVDGAWRMRFNIDGNVSPSTTSISLSVSGLTFKGVPQPCVCNTNGASIGWYGACNGGTNNIYLVAVSTSTEFACSGDVELNAKPTFVA